MKIKTDKQRYLENGFVKDRFLGEIKPNIWVVLILGIIGVLFLFFLFKFIENTGPIWWIIFIFLPAIPVFGFLLAYFIIRIYVDHQIAKMMSKIGKNQPANKHEPIQNEEPPNTHIPIEIIKQLPSELKSKENKTLGKAVTKKPFKTLYLWNFNSGSQYLRHCLRSWQRYGPVYLIPSPRYIPILKYFQLLFSNLENYFISSEKQLKLRLNQVKVNDKKRGWYFLYGKLYPRVYLHNADISWKKTLMYMLNYVDYIIIDARGFTKERNGLAWEMMQVIKYVPANNFLILANIHTDMQFLNDTIATIPNNRKFPDSGPIRIINLGWIENFTYRTYFLKADAIYPLLK